MDRPPKPPRDLRRVIALLMAAIAHQPGIDATKLANGIIEMADSWQALDISEDEAETLRLIAEAVMASKDADEG